MHGQQCQGCGSYDDSSILGVNPCEHCTTLICSSCTRNHTSLCKELQARKLRGEGPTIGNVPMFAHRRGHETPPTTGPDRPDLIAPTVIQAIVDQGMLELVQGFKDLIDGTYGSVDPTLSPFGHGLPVDVDKPESDAIEKQLDAIKDLLAE